MATATDPRMASQRVIQATARDEAASNATGLILNLLRCVLWLLRHGVFVVGFSAERSPGGMDRVTVRAAASPYLYILFGKDGCAWRQRRQEGALTTYTWFAERFGIRIEWEETCA